MFKQLLLLSIIMVLMLTATSADAQTPAGLESKYGSPVNTYAIRTGLLLMTKYDVTDQVCEMAVVEGKTPEANIITRVPLSAELVPMLIDELIPEKERGKKTRSYGLAQITGMTGQVLYDYENVSIELIQQFKPSEGWSDNILKIKWNNKVCK